MQGRTAKEYDYGPVVFDSVLAGLEYEIKERHVILRYLNGLFAIPLYLVPYLIKEILIIADRPDATIRSKNLWTVKYFNRRRYFIITTSRNGAFAIFKKHLLVLLHELKAVYDVYATVRT